MEAGVGRAERGRDSGRRWGGRRLRSGRLLPIVDGIVLPRFFFEPLRDALREAGHAVAYAVLRAPLDVCLARAGSRDSQPLADPLVVERLWHDFAELGPLSRHAVDVDAEDPQAAADLLAARIRDGSLRA